MAMKPKVQGFFLETWKTNIWLIWPVNSAQLAATLKRYGAEIEMEGDSWDGRCIPLTLCGSPAAVIALRRFEMTPVCIATLAHECFHATEFTLNGKVLHGDETTEVYAYLLDEIMRRCLMMLNGEKEKVKAFY